MNLNYQEPQYLVAWDGFATLTWAPAEGLNEATTVDLFYARRLDNPGRFLAGSTHTEPHFSRRGYCHGPNPYANPKGLVLNILEDDFALWLRGG
jgi:hypothetical protein